jgi:hypothetical protein
MCTTFEVISKAPSYLSETFNEGIWNQTQVRDFCSLSGFCVGLFVRVRKGSHCDELDTMRRRFGCTRSDGADLSGFDRQQSPLLVGNRLLLNHLLPQSRYVRLVSPVVYVY